MPKKQHWCGFCGKPDDEVERLLAGPCIEVCNECIDMMHKLVHTPKPIFTVKPPGYDPQGWRSTYNLNPVPPCCHGGVIHAPNCKFWGVVT